MIYFFVDNVIQTSCFSFLKKVAEADFYEQSSQHVSSAVLSAVSTYWNPWCILHSTYLSNAQIRIALSKACAFLIWHLKLLFRSSFVLSLPITVFQANNSMTTSEVDWLTLIHAAEVENFSKSISIRCIFSFAPYPFHFFLLLSAFMQNNNNSVALLLVVFLALMLVVQSKCMKLIILIKHTRVKNRNW